MAINESMEKFCDGLRVERMESLNEEFRNQPHNNEEFLHLIKVMYDFLDKNKVPNEVLFELFGLQKQGESGNCTMDKPWFYEPEKKGQYESWMKKKNMPMKEAQAKYMELAKKTMGK